MRRCGSLRRLRWWRRCSFRCGAPRLSRSRPTSCPRRRRWPTAHAGGPGAATTCARCTPTSTGAGPTTSCAWRRRSCRAINPLNQPGLTAEVDIVVAPDGQLISAAHRARLGLRRLRRRHPRGPARRGPVPDAAGRRSLRRRQASRPLDVRARPAALRGRRGGAHLRSASRSRCRSCCARAGATRRCKRVAHGPRRGPARRADVHAAGGRLDQGGDPRTVGDGAHGAAARRARRRRGAASG